MSRSYIDARAGESARDEPLRLDAPSSFRRKPEGQLTFEVQQLKEEKRHSAEASI
jgi:hypothetical protein